MASPERIATFCRRLAPPHGGVVHDVVVQEREIVEHLDGRRRGKRLQRIVGEDAAREHDEHRPQPFAASGERIADRRVQQFGFGREFGLCQVILDHREKLLVGLHGLLDAF